MAAAATLAGKTTGPDDSGKLSEDAILQLNGRQEKEVRYMSDGKKEQIRAEVQLAGAARCYSGNGHMPSEKGKSIRGQG